ncbi:hypothetical protein [Haloarcula sebkhae]|uniref:Uncharacterized protein n=2 Tax=Haloarcula sebkhae TaxID=932660 RepID=A0ACC6VRF0_9EURY|nr:hypothetical protein [Haloarcula sebkhae]GGK85073.1 hypothetical protein GCM10009067_41500 [Haloarcula sebkhae]
MRKLTKSQQERAEQLRKRRIRRIKKREELYESGGVEIELSSFFKGLAGNYQSVGILEVTAGDIAAAQDAFKTAVAYYHRSAEAHKFPVMSTNTLADGIYTAALAGLNTDVIEFADAVRQIHREHSLSPDDDNADRFFFAGCLAGALVDDLSDTDLDNLEAINETKPEPHSHYGDAIYACSQGIRDANTRLIERGIESMLTFHQQDIGESGVVGLTMSVQATALFVLARGKGYDPDISSPYIPGQLVEAASDGFDLT